MYNMYELFTTYNEKILYTMKVTDIQLYIYKLELYNTLFIIKILVKCI